MKRSLILLLLAAFTAVSCGTAAQYATTESRFQDGIYYKPVDPIITEVEEEEPEQEYILVDPNIAFPLLGYQMTSPWYHNPWYHSPWYYDRWSWSWGWNHWDPWYYNRWSWKWDWNWRYWDPWYYEMWCWDPFWSPGWGPGRWWGPGWGAWEPVGPIGPGGMRRDVYYGHRGATNVGGTVYSPGRGRTGGAGTIRGGIGSSSYVNYGVHRPSGTGTTSNYSYPKGTTGSTSGGGLRRSFEGSTPSSSGTSSSYNRSSSSNYSRGSSYSGGSSSYSSPSSRSYSGGSHSGGSGGHSGGGGSHGGHR